MWLRGAMFQVHLWSGLIVGLLATVAGVSGSAVVYREALDRRLAPELYRVQVGPALDADELLAGVKRALPGYSVRSVEIESGAVPLMFRVVSPKGRPETTYVDATNGRMLGVRGDREGIMNWLDNLHTELLGGDTGRIVNGIGAAGLFLLCVTGVVVWWPGRAHVRRAVRIHLPGRWRRFNWDLHTAGGFWIAVPLALVAFSGIYLCFGLSWVLVLLGGKATEFNDLFTAPKSTVTCVARQISIESMLRRVRGLHNNPEEMFVVLPGKSSDAVMAYARSERDLQFGNVTITAFDPCTGSVLRDVDSRTSSLALRTVFFLDAFHFGLVGGQLTKVAWVFLGLTPGILFVTGFILWWRRVVVPAASRKRAL